MTTVMRAWSRRIERAEDVVINRGPVKMIECGQAGEGAKDGLSTRPSITMEPEDSALPWEDSADADALTVAMTELEEAKLDYAPDSIEAFAELKEGPHRIIEHCTSPGEEVCFYIYVAF